jgi:hypothetical protein
MVNFLLKVLLLSVLLNSNPILMDEKCTIQTIDTLFKSKVKCDLDPIENCSIQSIEYLEKLFQYHFGKVEDTLRVYEVPNLRQDYEIVDSISNEMPPFCEYESLANELCPSNDKIITRNNLYPFLRNEVQCNCFNCDIVTNYDVRLSCRSIKKHYPVLIRGECNSITKNYEWRPGLERVSIACVCGRSPGLTLRKFKDND